MPYLDLKATHKPIRDYYTELDKTMQQASLWHEGAVAPHFANLLRACASKVGWQLAEQYQIPRKGQRPIRTDGVLLDRFNLRHAIWEAKDGRDDLDKEVKKKFALGYPSDNILFQGPKRAMLYQDGRLIADEDITQPERLVLILRQFFEYQPPAYEQWERAVEEFKERVPELAQSLLGLIKEERKRNKAFMTAFAGFTELVKEAINPNIADQAVEEMLIQHLLTERIFRKVFNNAEFAQRNVIAREIEKVINALTSRHFSREQFLGNLDRFYGAIEQTAATISDYSEKQAFLNTVYENFFQGFSVKVADTHGIVYTPQPIVEFMVRSVDDILKREFGKTEGLASDGVAILDPFVGTGNFLLRVMRQMPKSKLPHKYQHELFCNEVMLLPYYIASMNIEYEYMQLTGEYQPYEGLAFVDTFELAEGKQIPLFAPENSLRVKRQKDTPIFVIIGNPPYNAHQVNENDNNRNRKYPMLDALVSETYAKDSEKTNKNALGDMYVKAFRWASNRIHQEGIVAFVTNNSFLDSLAFDGMRHHLEQDFSAIYHINLKGNARATGEQRRREAGNVFNDMIRVGIGITFLVKKANHLEKGTQIYIYNIDDYFSSAEKQSFLEEKGTYINVPFQHVPQNPNHIWLIDGLQKAFASFLPLATKDSKAGQHSQAIFRLFSNGLQTNRDQWVYDFNATNLQVSVKSMLDTYNYEVFRWEKRPNRHQSVDSFVISDDTKIKWSSNLKSYLEQGKVGVFREEAIQPALYRPYAKKFVYFDELLIHRQGQWPLFLGENNLTIWLKIGSAWPLFALMTDCIADQLPQGGSQCFPFYTYNEDGTNRRENITDWALAQFQTQYAAAEASQSAIQNLQSPITKWDIFHYIYALLHHPTYRETYAANLRRDLPHIPFVAAEHFWAFVEVGRRLAEIHVHYEQQPEYKLAEVENPAQPLDYRVEKMRLSRDKRELKYNDFLTLTNIPQEVFNYKLGNRSALEWVIDQYQVSTDKRSGIVNDPNNLEDETYILRLIKQVITVSLETVRLVESLPPLEILEL